MQKSEARILDATAGNRTLWTKKTSPFVLWIDIEDKLEIQPDRIMDCTQTNFPDKFFHTIFFDPPHGWGKTPGLSFTAIRNMEEYENYPWPGKNIDKRNKNVAPYYGWDKYNTKTELLGFLHKAQKEFLRILSDDGILWLKWNECNLSIRKILPFFKDWNVVIRIPVCARQKQGKKRTYWLALMKIRSSLSSAKNE